MNINATILGQLVSFIIFVIFCMKYIWPPILNAIEKRQKEISDGLSDAEKAKITLKYAQQKSKEQLIQSHNQVLKILDQAHQKSIQILDKVSKEAQKERKRIILLAKREIESSHQRVREELRKEVVLLTIAVTEKLLENSGNEKINKNIIDKIITEL
ncbi:MAG: F0F1 ATP synthase subunit B [Candidatus Dasytiphilus stammeri]